ncbi:MAG: hypothetical protein M1839_003707 [Geoglossum umbratile]|nr:MAG: hypothetical protein M1839_003707 [Geoglossum umbratile]
MSGKAQYAVLVTGFGPFDGVEENPSFSVIVTLPTEIHLPDGRSIRLYIHRTPVPVAYDHVLKLVPTLYRQYPAMDYFVHVGVNAEAEDYQIEKRARKGDYVRKDVTGRGFEGSDSEFWRSLPQELSTAVDVDRLIKTAFSGEGTPKVSASEDAGLFLCEFIYYNSLLAAKNLRDEGGRNVSGVFVHVPGGDGPDDIRIGRDVLVAIISELVA